MWEYPCIATVPLDPCPELEMAMGRLSAYEWLALTSPAGVDALWRWLERSRLDARTLGGVRLAAIGPGTAKALAVHGLRADYVPEVYDAAHLGEGIPAAGRVLILRAQEGSPALTEALPLRRAAGRRGIRRGGDRHLHQRLHRQGLRVHRGGGRGLLPHGGGLHR